MKVNKQHCCDILLSSQTLSPVHTSNNVEATSSNAYKLNDSLTLSTVSNVASTLLPFVATKSNVVSTMLVACCFDIVAGVDGALAAIKRVVGDKFYNFYFARGSGCKAL